MLGQRAQPSPLLVISVEALGVLGNVQTALQVLLLVKVIVTCPRLMQWFVLMSLEPPEHWTQLIPASSLEQSAWLAGFLLPW